MGRGIDVWIVAWGISALISAVAISVRMRLRPRVTGSLTWARQASKISGQMFADFFVTTGAQQLVIFLVPLVSSLAVLGALKAAQVAAGPLQMGLTAASVVAIPSVARLSGEGRLDLAARRGLQLSGAVFVIGVLYTGVLVAVPVDLGMKAFGDSWIKAAHIAGFVGMQCALVGVLQGAIVVLRGTRNTRRGLIVRLWLTPLNILCPIAGAAIDGIRGLGIAMVVTASFAVVIWWGAAWRTVRTMVRQAKARPDGASRAETARERVA
jgi:O-antigen/teichoic acid export membrane protein